MQKELIYIPSAKVIVLQELTNFYKGNFYGETIKIKNIDKLGDPFSFTSNENINNPGMVQHKLETTFQNPINSASLVASLAYYLRIADIPFTLSKRENNFIQYLGLVYGKPSNIWFLTEINNSEREFKKSIIPCHFYLIKDNLQLETYFKEIYPAS